MVFNESNNKDDTWRWTLNIVPQNIGNFELYLEIELEFYPLSGGNTKTTKYIIKQCGLHSIEGYKLESYEEYLHTYDSADKYSLETNPIDYTQQGLAWDTKEGVIYSGTIVVGAANSTTLAGDYRYDFYHKNDQPTDNTYYSWEVIDGKQIMRRIFCPNY